MAANAMSRDDRRSTYYIEDQPREARNRYEIKLTYNKGLDRLPDPYNITTGWVNDMTVWPDLTFGDIYTYLIDSPGVYTKESLKAYKSLDAYKYVQSGHVQEVLYHPVEKDCPFAFLKADVIPSQRITDKPHQPWICVQKESGTIYCAHCTCMAGLGEVCSHVAATLFKVQLAVHLGLTTKSSTSDICRWNSTFRKELEPQTVNDMQEIMRAGNRSKPVTSVPVTSNEPLPPENILKSLKDVCPNATFFTTIPPVGPANECKPKPTLDKIPTTLTSLYSEQYQDKTGTELSDFCKQVWSAYSVSEEQSSYIERTTRDQNVCQKWFEHRKGRITASKAHDVLVRREGTSPDNLVKSVAGYDSYDLSRTKAVRWGIDNEDVARAKYFCAMKSVHRDFSLRKSGLLIDSRKPFLGASADGIRECACCGTGSVEIKCPYKHRDETIDNAATSDKTFCLDKNLKLKTEHKYYAQVQMQMFVNRMQFCDFVIYTEKDMIVNVIPFNREYTAILINKCEAFFQDNILPELVTRQIFRKIASDSVTDNDERLYCICQEPAYGKMVQCGNEDCPNEWFHFPCMQIRRKPRGTWLCPDCKCN